MHEAANTAAATMRFVNAADTLYQYSGWLVNICSSHACCLFVIKQTHMHTSTPNKLIGFHRRWRRMMNVTGSLLFACAVCVCGAQPLWQPEGSARDKMKCLSLSEYNKRCFLYIFQMRSAWQRHTSSSKQTKNWINLYSQIVFLFQCCSMLPTRCYDYFVSLNRLIFRSRIFWWCVMVDSVVCTDKRTRDNHTHDRSQMYLRCVAIDNNKCQSARRPPLVTQQFGSDSPCHSDKWDYLDIDGLIVSGLRSPVSGMADIILYFGFRLENRPRSNALGKAMIHLPHTNNMRSAWKQFATVAWIAR